MKENPTHLLCDIDGVIRREGQAIPGVADFFHALTKHGIQSSLLSNNSRQRGADVVEMLRREPYNVQQADLPQGISSADATAQWMKANPYRGKIQKAYVIGEKGIRDALTEIGIPMCEDEWDGEKWKGDYPSHVVVGFSKQIDYKKLSGAWNAIKEGGASFVATNGDPEYRNEGKLLLPANGAALGYLSTTGKNPLVIGKPNIEMGEIALKSLNADKKQSRVAVLGDTFDQDIDLAKALRRGGWNAEAWVVLSGVITRDQLDNVGYDDRADRIFDDISDVRRKVFA